MKTKYLFVGIIIYLVSCLATVGQNVENEPFVIGSDSVYQNTSLTISSTINTDSTLVIDSLFSNNIILDSVFYLDSLEFVRKQNDTLPKEEKTIITSKIETSANDSTIFSIDGKKVFLFGEAEINYEDINLQANYIEIDMDKGIMYAEGTKDTVLNEMIGEPIFKQGDQEMKAKTITYNLKTEKGFIKDLYTEQDEGYLHSSQTKKTPDNSVNLHNGKFTTCELEHPHFYLSLTKGKMVPDKAIVAGFSFLVIEDIPLYPLAIPFGYFPSTQEKASGFIIPTFGEEKSRGVYLQRGGYYFALNDYSDLTLTGDVYSKGSWLVQGQSKYKMRYKFSGNVDISYSKVIWSDVGLSDYSESKEYRVVWNHSQDAKARPNSNFSASVNFRSMGDNKYNENAYNDRLAQTISSSISYRKSIANSPFSMSANLRHSQNLRDSTVDLTLPQMTMSMAKVFPFRKKTKVGKMKWYENIGVNYSGNYENKVSVKDSVLFTPELLDNLKYGLKHDIPISTTFKVLKHMSVNPSINFTDRMYFKRDIRSYYNDSSYTTNEESGFYNLYDFGAGVSFNTKLYGMYQYKSKKIKAIRHVATPSISFNYRPDFSDEKFGFYMQDTNEALGYYNPYENHLIYGMPGTGKSGSIGLSLNNNIEMKVASSKDTITGERKIKLLDALNFSTSYNLMADSLKWAPLTMSARTKLFNIFDINLTASGDFYALDSAGSRYNTFEYNNSGKLIRLTRVTGSTGISFSSEKLKGKEPDRDENIDNVDNQYNDPRDPRSSHNNIDFAGYDYFAIPWSVNINYSLTYSKVKFTPEIIQTASFSGNFSLTPKWKVAFSSGWDFEQKKISYTSFNISRDLHCWVASVNVIPFGQYQSYNFTIGIKSGMLRDIKYNKAKSWIDNAYNN